MKRIDISEWGEFNISDLFELILPKGDNQAQKLADGKIPLISSGVAENGIVKYIAEGEPNSEIYSGKKLTVDMFGQAFYHNYDFYAVSHGRINILIPKFKNISKNIGSFLASVMTKKFNSKYGFSEMCSQKMLSKEKIKLPARKNEQGELEPDWLYMESYMRDIQIRAIDKINSLSLYSQAQKHSIDVAEWGEFKVSDLFELVNSKAYHTKDIIKVDDNKLSLNYVTRSKFNNGLKTKVLNGGGFLVNPSKTISFGAENANFFYQEEPYITGNKMYYIDTQFLSSLSARFLESILNATFSNNFSFSDGMIPSRIKDEKIKLPARKNEQGELEPDWSYMETYTKNVQQKANARLDNLQNKIKTHKTA